MLTPQFLLFVYYCSFALCIVLDVAALQFVGRSRSVFLNFEGTSHNLSWSRGGGVEEKLGGFQFFWDGIWGALKCQKMTLGGGPSSFF